MHLRGVATPMVSANKPYNHIYLYIYTVILMISDHI